MIMKIGIEQILSIPTQKQCLEARITFYMEEKLKFYTNNVYIYILSQRINIHSCFIIFIIIIIIFIIIILFLFLFLFLFFFLSFFLSFFLKFYFFNK